MTHVAVIGGGPAGLAAAYRLTSTAHADVSVRLLERAPRLGGLAAGMQHGAFNVDFGPHRLHRSIDPLVLTDLRQLLGPDLVLKRRIGRIRLRGRYLPYPIGPRTIVGLGPRRVARFAGGLLAARVTKSGDDSYAAVLRSRLGSALYDEFYAPYAEKVWGRSGDAIDAGQAERRVNQRGILDVLRLAMGQSPGRFFFYPRGGFGALPAAYARALYAGPTVNIETQASVERINWHAGRAVDVTWRKAETVTREPFEDIVWSAPLPELIRRLEPPPPADVVSAAEHLRTRAVVLFYVVLNRPRVGVADTYYFPEPQFPFNRVIEQKNFSETMAPADQTVLGMDIACDANDEIFDASDGELRERVIPRLEEAGLANRHEVQDVFSQRFRSAYPVYERGAAARIGRVFDWLSQIDNLWLVGRQGLFLHNNTHHSLYMGYRVADAILHQQRVQWPDALAEFDTFRVAD